ncbi:MAG: hypothetical protein MJ009_03240 [Paludibacteraceae bacterium]|nr:hypothetical protein [Paludibacteraceae bacterium]
MRDNNTELLFSVDEDGKLQLLTLCLQTFERPTPIYSMPTYCQMPEEEMDYCPMPAPSKSYMPEEAAEPSIAREPKAQSLDIVDEFKANTEKLIQMGFSDEQIIQIIKDCRQKKSILIDHRFRIFLIDDRMVEVEMNPLSKTLFLFYLKHPEGVALKCLSDYKAELCGIYSRLTGRESVKDIEKSIIDMVDPTSNSVHEKCSRIKAAFKNKVSASTISDYVPSGIPGEPRFISLDRNLITWECRL